MYHVLKDYVSTGKSTQTMMDTAKYKDCDGCSMTIGWSIELFKSWSLVSYLPGLLKGFYNYIFSVKFIILAYLTKHNCKNGLRLYKEIFFFATDFSFSN